VNYQHLKKNLNVIVEPNGNIHLTRRTKLNQDFQKKKPIKRLHKTWIKGLRKSTSTKIKSKKEKKNKKTDDTPVFLILMVNH